MANHSISNHLTRASFVAAFAFHNNAWHVLMASSIKNGIPTPESMRLKFAGGQSEDDDARPLITSPHSERAEVTDSTIAWNTANREFQLETGNNLHECASYIKAANFFGSIRGQWKKGWIWAIIDADELRFDLPRAEAAEMLPFQWHKLEHALTGYVQLPGFNEPIKIIPDHLVALARCTEELRMYLIAEKSGALLADIDEAVMYAFEKMKVTGGLMDYASHIEMLMKTRRI